MNKRIKVSLMLMITVILSGCSAMSAMMHSSNASSDSEHYIKAKNLTNVQTKVVKEYIPVAMPGQLMPIPSKIESHAKVFRSKKAAVQYANKQATQYPDQNDFFNSMATYNYMPGAIYTVYTAPLKITDVVLGKGEKLISQAAGDTLRWQIAQTYSGEEGVNLRQHILIKPTKPNIENSVVLTTNKRTYHLLLKSTDTSSYMVSLKWSYPGKMVTTFNNIETSGDPDITQSGDHCPSFDISKIKFNYSWKMLEGDKPNWNPRQIFSVNGKTYIKFSSEFMKNNNLMPMLEISDSMEKNKYATMSNWRFHCGYIIVDSIITKARLVAGVESNSSRTIVQINQK